jgi:hypothetical protein
MAPRAKDMNKDSFNSDEGTPLTSHLRVDEGLSERPTSGKGSSFKKYLPWALLAGVVVMFGTYYWHHEHRNTVDINGKPTTTSSSDNNNAGSKSKGPKPSGPYQLVECQEGEEFFDFYDFYDGEDSLGSAGYNRYVNDKRAFSTGIANVSKDNDDSNGDEEFVYMSSQPTVKGPRESVRLEGRTLWNRGLFILDLRHMPAGCGVWPAFWLTNEEHWPEYGEIDVVEGINNQTLAKTAMHTSDRCSMYAHVADYNRTGVWDRASKYCTTP